MVSSDTATEKNIILAYYKGLAACSKEFISGNPNALVRVLKELLKVTGVDRISFFENFVQTDGRISARNIHQLMKRGVDEQIETNGKGWFVYQDQVPEWEECLGKGEIVIVNPLSGYENQTESCGIKKNDFTLVVPLFTGNHWYGFLGFEELKSLHAWHPMEIEIITTAAEMIGGYIEKELYIRALIKDEERYRSIIENINEGYYEIDFNGVFTFANKRLCRMTRKVYNHFIGMNLYTLVPPETGNIIRGIANQVYETGVPSGLNQTQFIREDGSKVVYEFSITLIEDANGGKKGFRGIVRDVTETLNREKKQKELEEKYFEVQKLESIATLAGGLAHEFNNLLMGIQGNTSLLLVKYHSDPAVADKVINIERSIKRGSEITNKLLGFARSGKYQETQIDLGRLLNEVCDLFGKTRIDIRIHQRYQPGLWPITGDFSQVEQIFLNLLLNASQAMPQGGEIRILAENHSVEETFAFLHDSDPGDYVMVKVADTGIGMDETTRKRVFEPFFTTMERHRGTGLGLASVYGIVKNHSGIITLESKRGKGTCFMIYFPVSQDLPGDCSVEQSTSDKQMSTILVVDDEKTILDINSEILEVLGYRVIAADSSRNAIELFVKHLDLVDLVIMDVIMPDRNGFETAGLLREIKEDVKILFVSGFPKSHNQFKHEFTANEAFLQKPYTLEQLAGILSNVLKSEKL
ncbi:MAG: ATP-binding protein [Desulfobacterium sp.]|jgi:PAS domain S-box-containing protein|nr:ATP-binding protein [Desulfobacterium sp.]